MNTRNVRMAIRSLRVSRWRSLMTMTGVILGVVSVITTISLGEGVKQQVLGQINHLGSDLITVRPGDLVKRDKDGNITHINQLSTYAFGSGSLSNSDLDVIAHTPLVKEAVPLSVISSSVKADSKQYTDGTIYGTSKDLPNALNQNIAYGKFFDDSDSDHHVAVIGKRVAEQLFGENVPIGSSLSIRGQEFVVIGIFQEFTASPLTFGPDFNKAVFIPYAFGQGLTGNTQLSQVFVKPDTPDHAAQLVVYLNKTLSAAHAGQADFTVLKQDETLVLASDTLNIFTAFIAGVAALSLLVGGIGIMNIMLVSVTERTREIGIRKAVGATNRQILSQFFVEATVLSGTGGAIGIIIAYAINFALRSLTHLNPVITLPIVLVAACMSLLLGIIFGIIPALRAAHKDPMEALRYE
jgi:putative ABC transport system permease protein